MTCLASVDRSTDRSIIGKPPKAAVGFGTAVGYRYVYIRVKLKGDRFKI